jgi:hypothetical protein
MSVADKLKEKAKVKDTLTDAGESTKDTVISHKDEG